MGEEQDQILVRQCLQGDALAWEKMVSAFGGLITRQVRRYGSLREEAEDLTQEVFLKVYLNLGTFRTADGKLRVRAKISSHFGASAGRADARRRDVGDVVTSSRSGNAADARPPPRPAGQRLPGPPTFFGAAAYLTNVRFIWSGGQMPRAWKPTAECEVIFARALSHWSVIAI